MTYLEAITYLESLIDYERTPAGAAAARVWNLDRIGRMLHEFGDPHLGLRCVHIAGTKGKGSTAAMTASILSAAGLRTGLYTSPHLISFRERIRVDGRLISEEEVVSLVERALPVIESLRTSEVGPPSFFEVYTLIGFLHFARQQADVVVLEAGLGGRLDATNIAQPLACAITHINFDHMQELGDTIAQIAGEKAGIIKPGACVISSPQLPEALEVLQEVCLERRAQLLVVGQPEGPQVSVTATDLHRQVLTIRTARATYRDLECPLLGPHQAENAAVAVGLAECLSDRGIHVSEKAIREGIRSVRWPGRFEIVSRRPYIILDGAHDVAGAAALARTLESLLAGRRIILVLGIQREKDADAIAALLCPLADRAIATASSSPRAIEAHDLQRVLYQHCRHTAAYTPVSLALREALDQARSSDVIVITGSLYVVGEAMRALGRDDAA